MTMEAKRKRHADHIPMEEEGRKSSKKKKKKKKMKMEAKKKRYADVPMEDEVRKTSVKKMKRKSCYVDIPVDVLVDILSRVPARCVWKLRSVSKDWKTLIESPYFADLQLRQSKEETLFMVWMFSCPYFNTRFYSIDKHNGKAVRVVEEFCHRHSAKASSINGLVSYCGADGEIKVCNPVTREVITLPRPSFFPSVLPKTFNFDIAIGLDSTTKRYKVLATPAASTSEVEIFTLGGTRGWKKVQIPSVRIWRYQSDGLYANGCLFWLTSQYHFPGEDTSRALTTFNFAQEKFEFVQLPPDVNIHHRYHLIREVGGHLCLIEENQMDGMVKMWTLADSGTQLWVHHNAVLPSYEWPLFPIPSGAMLFKRADHRRYMCFYNEQGQVVKSLKVHGIPSGFRPVQLHKESLVSLKSILAANL